VKQEPWSARAENPGPSGPGEVNVIPFAIPVQADPMERLASHQRTCILCALTPPDQSPCGQRIRMERDMGVVRGGWKQRREGKP
jgi:hypothetical protein